MEDIKTKHHVHVPKRVREYMIELLSTFIAVALAFLSQYYFQYRSDRSTEHDLMVSLIADLRLDSKNIQKLSDKFSDLDDPARELAQSCRSFPTSLSEQTHLYDLVLSISLKPFQIDFSTATINQLKNSGGLRLVQYHEITDAITRYDNEIHHMEILQENVIMRKKEFFDNMSINLYTDAITFYPVISLNKKLLQSLYKDRGTTLISKDANSLIQLGNLAVSFTTYAAGYIGYANRQKSEGDKLISLIQSHYHIE